MKISAALVAAFGAAGIAQSQIIAIDFDGTTEFNGWQNLTTSNPQVASANPAFPSNPGDAAWPEPVESDAFGSGDAQLNKVDGSGFFFFDGLYTSTSSNGTFSVTDATPVQGVQNIAFQITLAAGTANFLDILPTLTINGDTVVSEFLGGGGTITGTIGAQVNPFLDGQVVGVVTLLYQWDLTNFGPVDSFEILFATGGTSTSIQAIQVDQSSAVFAKVPAPGAIAAFGFAGLAVSRRRRG